MKFAFLKNELIEASKGAKGVCPCCGSELVARCGEIKIHHWAHKKKCDDHWWENETEWHRNWKNQFPKEWQEIIQKDDSGEKHIADVKTSSGWTIEFQHSAISKNEQDSRDYFYTNLIWIVDGTRRQTDIKQLQNLLDTNGLISFEPFILSVNYPEDYRLIREWSDSNSFVLFDFGKSNLNYRDYSIHNSLWFIHSSKGRTFISTFLKDSFIELLNNADSNEVYKTLLEPIQKELDEHIAEQEDSERARMKKLKEEDLKIRKEYGIKDDEDWFDGRWGIKAYKRPK